MLTGCKPVHGFGRLAALQNVKHSYQVPQPPTIPGVCPSEMCVHREVIPKCT